LIAAFCCPAFAAGKQKGKDELANLPVLADVEMYPIGDAEVVVGFKGKGLPEPETVFDVNRVRITFKEVRLDASDMTDYSAMVPMLSNVSTAQVSRDVVIEMTAESPLQLRSTRGVAPADSYTLRFITSAKVEKMVQEPAATRVVVKKPVPTGPFASTTPITTAVTRARTACNPMERSRASRGSGNEANTPAAIYDPGGATWGAAQPPHSWGSPMSSSRRTA